jgi:hypothetical protein
MVLARDKKKSSFAMHAKCSNWGKIRLWRPKPHPEIHSGWEANTCNKLPLR